MTVKLNQYWTVKHDKTAKYSNFVVKEYVPELNNLGIHIIAGWTVLLGGYSEIYLEGVTDNLELLERALWHDNFDKLRKDLDKYVYNYKTKVLTSTGRYDSYSKDLIITEDTIKITQAWDIKSDKEHEYDYFVLNKFYPMLEDLSIEVTNEWKVLIGEGPNIICEGRVKKADNLMKNLKSQKFQRTRAKLKRLIQNYESRALTLHVGKNLGGYKTTYYGVISV